MQFTMFSSIMALFAIFVPVVALHAHMLFVECIFLVALLLAGYLRGRLVHSLAHGLSLVLIALLFWALVSTTWSIDPSQGIVRIVRLLAFFLVGILTVNVCSSAELNTQMLCGKALSIGILLSAVIFFVDQLWFAFSKNMVGVSAIQQLEHYSEYKVFGTVIGALFIIITAYYAHQKRWILLSIFSVLLLSIVLLSNSSSAIIALVLGMGVFGVFLLVPRVSGIGMMVAIPIVFFLLPLVPFGSSGLESWMEPNALHRVAIWRFATNLIADAPWIGYGLDSSRSIPGGDALVQDGFLGPAVRSLPQWKILMGRGNAELLPLHPHNLALQVWLELGGVGVFLVSTFYLLLVRSICFGMNRPLVYRAGLVALLVYTLIIGFLSFGAWQSWWIACQIVLWMVGICLLRRRHPVQLPLEFAADRT